MTRKWDAAVQELALSSSLRKESRFAWYMLIGLLVAIIVPTAWLYWSTGNGVVTGFFLLLIGAASFIPLSPRGYRSPAVPSPILGQPNGTQADVDALQPSRFGPNGRQVMNFLFRLPLLTEEHWRVIAEAVEPQRSSAASWLRRWIKEERAFRTMEEISLRELDRAPAEQQALTEIEAATEQGIVPFVSPHALYWATRQACTALVFRDVLPPGHFAVLYAPFNRVIPAASLESST
jgi:hypothetical protein